MGLILTLALLWPLFQAPYFSQHDDVQTIRLYEMDKCFKDGQIPCRWVPDLGGLYGYPLFNYYAPLPYYYGEIFYSLTHSLLFSAKLMFVTAFVGSFIFMFLLARKLWGGYGALISGVFYAYAPYHAVDFYVRGAMEEMWALMLFPAILWALFRLKESTRIYNVMLLGLFLALLMLSHNLSAMIFLPIIFTLVVFFMWQKRDFRLLKLVVLSGVLAFLLSAFYFLPMVAEKNLVHVETTVEGYFSYTEHFKGLYKLFIQRNWGWGASVREVPGGEKDGMSFQIGWVHLLGWFLALATAAYLWKKDRPKSLLLVMFSLFTVASVFMIHPRSEFIWKLIDPLKYLQFPWRFLMLIIFFVSLMSGSIFVWLSKKKAILLLSGLIILVVAANFTYFRPEKFIQVTDQQLLTGKNWDTEIKRSIFDFLPIYAQEPPAELATTRYQVVVGNAKVTNFKEGTNWFNFNANIDTHTILLLSQYYFPNWKVYVDGQEVKVEYKNNHLGLMSLIIGPGNHYISGKLENTTIRSAGNLISLGGVLIFLLLIPTQIPSTRRWLTYYLKALYR